MIARQEKTCVQTVNNSEKWRPLLIKYSFSGQQQRMNDVMAT